MMTTSPICPAASRRLVGLFAGTVFCLGMSVGAAKANFVVNGSFENPGTYNYTLYTSSAGGMPIPGWTSNNNEIEIDTSGAFGLARPDGTQSVELNGNTFDTISQTISGLTVGQKYLLTWAYAGRTGSGPEQMNVTFGGNAVGTDTSNGSTQSWSYNNYVIKATSTTAVLSFAAINVGGSQGLGNELDAVSLNIYVPEPATIALLLTPIAGVVVYRARRKATVRNTAA